MQTAPPDQMVGRVLDGRYRILDRLARGGMSTVYSALDERLDRHVAVKVMSPALSADQAFAGRFEREARISARLSHPNIVSIFDQGTDAEGHTYLVMELVRGRTLRDVLREHGSLTPAQALTIMEPVLAALAAAHRASYMHKDVKPENILISDDGVVKVTDFGLARAIESDAANTRTGLMMGTVAYCSPEQISGGRTDARSDIYAAGVVLFELLTGGAPFTGDSAVQVAYQHVHSDVPAPSTRVPSVPPELDEFVLRATNRHPAGRPMDAGAMLAELRDVRADLALAPVSLTAPLGGVVSRSSSAPATDAGAVTAPIHAIPPPGRVQHTTVQPGARGVVGTKPAPASSDKGARSKREQKRSAYQSPERRRRQRRRTVLAVLVIALLGTASGYGAWWLVKGRYHALPNVTGESPDAAISDLGRIGFVVVDPTTQTWSETIPSGQVISTDPPAGSREKSGTKVHLVVSKGPERFKLPVASGAYASVAAQLSTLPVQVVRKDVPDPSGKVPAGQVLGLDPPAGSSVKRGATVTVYVSTGPPMVAIPDLTNQKADDATALLQQAGFKVSASENWSDTVDAGKVISQNPPAGGQAAKFSTISIVVSKGPSATIPTDIVPGSDPNQAKAELDALGFDTVVHKKGKGFFDFSGYVVDHVDPGPGTVVAKGSRVDLYVK